MIGPTERFTLNQAGVRGLSGRLGRFLAEQGQTEQEAARLRLTMETLLRRVSERVGYGTDCALTLGRRVGRVYIRVDYPGKPFDPTVVGREDEGELWSARLLTELGLVPEWSWRRDVNRLVLRPRGRERGMFAASLAALALALALGAAGGRLPAGWTQAAERIALTPLLTAYSGVLRAFAGALAVFSVAAGICGAGDTAAFAPGGKRMIVRFLLATVLWPAAGTAAMAALAGLRFDGAFPAAASGKPLTDVLTPFLRGDAVQIAFLAAVCGAALLLLGGRAARVREWTEQCASVCSAVMEGFCRLAPLAGFAALLRGMWRHGFSGLAALWKPLALFSACALVLLLCKLAAAALALRTNPARLLKRIAAPLSTAFLAGSSAAAFGETMDNCENVLRLPHGPMLMGLSVGNRLCAPAFALCYSAAAVFLAAETGAETGALWLSELALLGVLFAMVSPGAPGALLGCFGLLLTSLGLPAEDFALMAVLNVLLGPLSAAVSTAYLQLELMTQEKTR